MSPLTVRRRLAPLRRRLAGLAIMVALGGAVTAHHAGISMSDMEHDGLGAAVELCAAALIAIGAVAVAIAIGLVRVGRWRPTLMVWAVGADFLPGPPEPRARPGPRVIYVLCSLRR